MVSGFPLLDGGLAAAGFNLISLGRVPPPPGLNKHVWDDVEIVSTTIKESHMNTLAPLFIVLALLIVTVVLLKIGKIRHSHIVSEGCVGLLYHKGKFVRALAPGRHVHWGRHFTIRWVDVRRASILLPGQDGKTGSADRKPEDGAS